LVGDPRRPVPGEKAFWLYKRGLARLNWNHRPQSVIDLDAALAAGPVGWVEGRIHVTRGQLADVDGRRPAAVGEDRKAIDLFSRFNDPVCVADARKYTRKPFALQ